VINVIVPKELSSNNRNLIKKVCDLYSNSQLNFITFSDELTGIESKIEHISTVAYYRLLLHKYITDFDICIWLDSDTVICSDVSELVSYDIKENYIAGVKASSYQLINPDKHCKRLGIPSVKSYINSGVLIMNLKKLREDSMENIFWQLAKNNYDTIDQDVFNVACFGKIFHLHFKYNFQPSRLYEANENIFNMFPLSEIKQAYENPIVVHFLDKVKPWQDSNNDFKECWFSNYIKLTEIISEFKGFYSIEKKTKQEIDINIINSKNLVLYGAGYRGNDILAFLRYMNINNPNEIWDRSFEKITNVEGINVVAPKFDRDSKFLNDITLIICIDDVQVSKSIYQQSKAAGILNIYFAIDMKKSLWGKLLSDYKTKKGNTTSNNEK